MTYAPAFKPAFGVFGRTVRRHWPVLLGITAAYGLAQWGLKLAWIAFPVAPLELVITLKVLFVLAWGASNVLLVALFTQVAMAVADERPLVAAEILGNCASAMPVLAISVLLQYAAALAIAVWNAAAPQSQGNLILANIAGGFLNLVAALFVGLAVPIHVDRRLAVWPTLKASAALGRRRWRPVLGVLLLPFMVGAVFGAVSTVLFKIVDRAAGPFPDWVTDNQLWALPARVGDIAGLLLLASLYVVVREQADVAETFD